MPVPNRASATVLRISCLIAAIVASRFSRFETVSSSVNDRRAGCLLLLKHLLLDLFSTLLGLFLRHSSGLVRGMTPCRRWDLEQASPALEPWLSSMLSEAGYAGSDSPIAIMAASNFVTRKRALDMAVSGSTGARGTACSCCALRPL